ncbi:uncharacterized protein BDZ99DRAFT_467371 [Mytilinidion resinicola]|uniref:Uncharacterized protein n=1 Tax=Mytilinidion resinicola TaxID=574789 RepID=A0A6A6Y982_9PEZI|nr:uncharacterized protein BDZ99DRAFT_467371 [Mytilinidion resinicola]KAF2804685.1 hypothetical protein BDZ99DRAFT_467371 [Mytilinidion resinicola]
MPVRSSAISYKYLLPLFSSLLHGGGWLLFNHRDLVEHGVQTLKTSRLMRSQRDKHGGVVRCDDARLYALMTLSSILVTRLTLELREDSLPCYMRGDRAKSIIVKCWCQVPTISTTPPHH